MCVCVHADKHQTLPVSCAPPLSVFQKVATAQNLHSPGDLDKTLGCSPCLPVPRPDTHPTSSPSEMMQLKWTKDLLP